MKKLEKIVLNESMEKNFIPGYYQAIEKFEITPGAGWGISIKKDAILKYTEDNKLFSWSPLENDWILRKPPIQGTETLRPSAYGGHFGNNSMFNVFTRNTAKLTEAEANELIKSAVKETTLGISEAIKMLQKMDPKQKVKITFIDGVKQPVNEDLKNGTPSLPIGLENGSPEGINGLKLIFSPLEEDMVNDWNNDNIIKKLVSQKRIFLSKISYDKWGIWGIEDDANTQNYIMKNYSW